MPETSIIIRTLNEGKHLGNLLLALKEQDYQNYEVVIVDSGSTDATRDIARKFSAKIIEIEKRDFTFGYALNIGCKAARGKYLVIASGHVLPVDTKWLSNLLAPFQNEKIAEVYGIQLGHALSKFSERRDFKRIFGTKPIETNIALDYVNHANAALRRELFEKRFFDEYLFGLEDVEWTKYITGEGYMIRYEPDAAVYHIHEEKWYQVYNRYRREAIAARRIGLRHPPQGRTSFLPFFSGLFLDSLASFPNWSRTRLEEILRFRYYQWKGSRQGWFIDKDFDLDRSKFELLYPSENKTVVIRDRHSASLEEVPLEEMRPGDVLIKVLYVGVCKTDLEVYEGSLGYYKSGLARYPIVPGHEFSGTIVKIGANNKYRELFRVGERVVGECILNRSDGPDRKEVGVINYNGAYGELVIVPGGFIHKIPDTLDSRTAVLAEPLAVVLRSLRRLGERLKQNSKVAVIGAGQIGNLSAQVLARRGYDVVVYDTNPKRLELLKNSVKGTHTSLDDLGGFDVIIEATGSKEVLDTILTESRINSTLLLLGFPYGNTKYNFEDIVGEEKVIIGSLGGEREDFVEALKLLPELTMVAFTETVLPLKDFKRAWELLRSGKYFKILLQPNQNGDGTP